MAVARSGRRSNSTRNGTFQPLRTTSAPSRSGNRRRRCPLTLRHSLAAVSHALGRLAFGALFPRQALNWRAWGNAQVESLEAEIATGRPTARSNGRPNTRAPAPEHSCQNGPKKQRSIPPSSCEGLLQQASHWCACASPQRLLRMSASQGISQQMPSRQPPAPPPAHPETPKH
jgi:hypothetical protein